MGRPGQLIDAEYDGPWELPVLGEVTAPAAVLIRPDGYVAWVGDGTDAGLRDALAPGSGRPPRPSRFGGEVWGRPSRPHTIASTLVLARGFWL